MAGRTVRAPRGTEISCKSWQQEAALRMLMNNLDPEVAERPEDLVVYGGIGKAARNWECFDAIVRCLRELGDDETLLVQSGKPVGVFRTHADAPRVLIANSMLVPAWATWEHFYELERKGLMMYGQMTAGSWIYIGTQGILQGTYETFAEAARQHFGGIAEGTARPHRGAGRHGRRAAAGRHHERGRAHRASRWTARASSGGWRRGTSTSARRTSTRRWPARATRRPRDGRSPSASSATPRTSCPSCVRRGRRPRPRHRPDQRARSAQRLRPERDDATRPRCAARRRIPRRYMREAYRAMGEHVRAMLDLQKRGAVTFDYGNNIRAQAQKAGVEDAFDFPGFVPAYIRPLFCEGKGPFRWAVLSGDPADLAVTDEAVLAHLPRGPRPRAAGSRSPASASPSRACPRASAGSATASARRWGSCSTSWCARARSARPS